MKRSKSGPNHIYLRWLVLSASCALLAFSCGKTDEATGPNCTIPVTGTKWSPAIPSASASNHDPSVVISTSTTSYTGVLTGLQQAVSNGQLISVDFDITQDLGAVGSITLEAKGTSFPTNLVGTAIPFLISLTDPNGKEYVNLARSGGSDCLGLGLFDCSDPDGCVSNAACLPNWPSGYTSREQWEQHQLLSSGDGYPSVNTFPTCTWVTTGGNANGQNPPSNFPKCAFKEDAASWLTGTTLPQGTYHAKYALVATRYQALGAAYTGGFQFKLIQKKTGATLAGAVDLNIILVGTSNVNASRTAKGQQNLNTLFEQVSTYYGQAGTGIKLGAVNAVEWPCETGGDAYANVGTAGLGDMFTQGASLVSASTSGKALNIFLTSTIKNDVSSLGSGVIIDGFSGAIGGPTTNGTPASGLVFATFDSLDTYNSSCDAAHATCALTEQEDAFWNMETTVTHEMGHYLGLNHPGESDGTVQDQIYDTPVCTSVSASLHVLTINSCLNIDTTDQRFSTGNPGMGQPHSCNKFCTAYNSITGVYCPTITECAFNDIMWYTSKNFTPSTGAGDGNLFSAQSGMLLNRNPYVQ